MSELTRALIVKAVREKRFRPRAVRIDSTVIEADVRYPTDAGLASSGVRVLAREGRKLAKLISVPWMMGTTMDLKFPEAQGQRFMGLGLLHWGFGTLLDFTSVSTLACRQFYEVMHMRRGMEALLRPDVLAAFALYGIKSLFVPFPQRANVHTLPRAPA